MAICILGLDHEYAQQSVPCKIWLGLVFVIGKCRPISADHDRPLYGDEYGGIKVGNILLIQIVLSYCLRFWRFDTLENH